MTYSRSSRSFALGVGNLLHSIGIMLSNSVCLRPATQIVALQGEATKSIFLPLYCSSGSSTRNWRISQPAECRLAPLRWAHSWQVKVVSALVCGRSARSRQRGSSSAIKSTSSCRNVAGFCTSLLRAPDFADVSGEFANISVFQNPCARRSESVSSASRRATERSQYLRRSGFNRKMKSPS